FGFPVLRFNFRGTGLSEGEHDKGNGELEDVRTALDWLEKEYTCPIIFTGFSFGAAVGSRAACPDARVQALIALGLPVTPIDDRSYDYSFLGNCAKPKLFVSGSRDQFGPRVLLDKAVGAMAEPKKLVIIEAGDHFFEGRLRELRDAIETWVRETLVPSSQPALSHRHGSYNPQHAGRKRSRSRAIGLIHAQHGKANFPPR